MKTVNGLAYPDADEFMVGQVSQDGTYQLANLTAALRHVTDRTVAIDGGAHIGLWSKVMSRYFDRVIAAEPSPDTFEALCANLSDYPNVERRHVALGDQASSVQMALDPEQAKKANTGARYITPGGTIRVETIDSWALERLGFLKLDVEGSEFVALKGAADTLRRCRPVVLFENKYLWSKHYGLPKQAVATFLTSLGYRCRERVSRDEIWAPA